MITYEIGYRTTLPDPLQNYTTRELKWLWYYLEKRHKLDDADKTPPPRYSNLTPSERLSRMNKAIRTDKNSEELMSEIIACHKDELIPEEQLKWIDIKDDRILIWCLLHLCEKTRKEIFIEQPFHKHLPAMPYLATIYAETRHQEIIAAIDRWKIRSEDKILFLFEKKNEWIHYKISDKQIKWINPKDDGQLVWAWEYLEKHRKALAVPKPANTKEYHAAVLASLDDLSYGHPSDKKLFMEQMKRTWSQKKFRDSGKAKKPYYLPLTINTKKKLEWLAENSGQKPVDILEQLILENYSKAQKGE